MTTMALSPEFLARFGIVVRPALIDRETCDRIRDEMLAVEGERATVTMRLKQDELAERYRKTTIAEVAPDTASLVQGELMRTRSALEESFSLELGPCEEPQFLLYGEGDYIRPHSDGSHADEAPDWIRRRTISAVLFLNDQSEEPTPETFSGGALTFYGLLSQDRNGRSPGLPIAACAGTLVAFPADMLHGVSEVTGGRRCTAVTWFARAEEAA